MIDVNIEAEKSLSKIKDCEVVYQYPKTAKKLPTISWYTITEHGDFATDNLEDIQQGTIAVDIWAKTPSKCGELAIKVYEMLLADDWYREYSGDVGDPDGIYHKTMRFTKDFFVRD